MTADEIQKAAKQYADDNITHESLSDAFIAGAEFAKMTEEKQIEQPTYQCNCCDSKIRPGETCKCGGRSMRDDSTEEMTWIIINPQCGGGIDKAAKFIK